MASPASFKTVVMSKGFKFDGKELPVSDMVTTDPSTEGRRGSAAPAAGEIVDAFLYKESWTESNVGRGTDVMHAVLVAGQGRAP
jgi:hypothetical protein